MRPHAFIHTGLFILTALLCKTAYAERLIFKENPEKTLGASSRLTLPTYTETSLSTALDQFYLAQTDLNQDGTNELILKPKNCEKEALCPHYILADTLQGIVSLGTIQAKTILLGNDYSHGIRNLMVFRDTKNDFAYSLFIWDPPKTSFVQRDTPS